MSELIFVYGTLKRDAPGSENERLGEAAALIGYGHVKGELIPGADDPALKDSEENLVAGEVYAVSPDVLPEIDDYEGPEYERKKTLVYLDDGTHAEAWVYFAKS